MKRILKTLFLALTIGIGQSKAEEINGMHYETSGDIVVGEWNTQYAKALAMGTAEGIPVVGFWLRPSCSMCKKIEVLNATEKVIAWRKERGYIFLVGVEGKADASKTLSLTQFGSHLPFVCVWWDKNGDGRPDVHVKWSGRNGDMPVKTGELDEQFMKSIDKYLGSYNPIPPYTGGTFACGDKDGDRLECEAGTKKIEVPLTRDEKSATVASESTLKVLAADGKTVLKTAAVKWMAGEASKDVEIDISTVKLSAGSRLTLQMVDADKAVQATTHVTYVEKAVSAANPLWIGERENLSFGEWTMDLDAAKALAKAQGGYTLMAVVGSLWCPDCANTDRNFLELTDMNGVNRFQAWAAENKVALVSVDVPNFSKDSVECASPSLLKRSAYSTTLARAREYPASGADASLTNAVLRSGVGYLSRKGVSEAEAAKVLARNQKLVSTNTDNGGVHRPEDTNKFRTGVPIFVLLRSDGTVAARLTRFASVSPMKADQANFDNYMKRFDEMLKIAAESGEHADKTEIENNWPSDKAPSLAANGGSAKGELCHADAQDVFALSGLAGNATERVEVRGTSAAEVTVQFYTRAADGTVVTAGDMVSGKLSSGVACEVKFVEKADCFVMVKAKTVTASEFAIANTKADNFIAYEIYGTTVLEPQESRATASSATGTLSIRLVKGTVYRFDGLKEEANLEYLTPMTQDAFCKFFRAKNSGVVPLVLESSGDLQYQIWNAGRVGFAVTSREVTESVCDKDGKPLKIVISRLGGASGQVKARVSLPEGESLDRSFTFNQTDLVWEEGDTADKTVDFLVEDDLYWSGTETVALKLEVLSSDAGDAVVAEGKSEFKLTVTEDDKQSPGRGLFCGVEPFAAKKLTVYAKSSQGATLCVGRVEGADGLVGAELKSSVAGVTFEAEDPRDLSEVAGKTILWWANRESGQKKIIVKGVPAGKTAKVTMAKYQTFGVVSASNTVSVVSVADDAPEFENAQPSTVTLYRYVDASATASFPVVGAQEGTVSFKKVSGALPSGVKATWDEERRAMVLTGAPTRAGTFTYCCQVSEKRGSKAVDGLLVNLKIVVLDPTAPGSAEGGGALNPACAKSRTLSGLPIVDPEARASGKRALFGTLDLTLPATGKASAKIITTDGTISLKAKSWSNADPETGTLSAMLVGTGKNADCTVSVEAAADGKVTASVSSDSLTAMVASDGRVWSKTDSAEAWKGYYTVAMPVEAVSGAGANLAADGSGYLTLKLTTASAWNSGKVTWAGVLPNGAAVSGSATLVRGADVAYLPLAKAKGIDAFTALLAIEKDAKKLWNEGCFRTVTAAQIESEGGVTYDVVPLWTHAETRAKTYTFEAELGAYGALYDASAGLDCCCFSFYETTVMNLLFDMPQSSPAYGALGPVASVPVQVAEKTIKLDTKAANPQKVKLSFNLSTGVVTGSFKLPCENGKDLSASFKGIVLMGWNEPCGCSTDKNLPFINAAWYFTDKVESRGVVRGSSMITDGAAE